MGRASEHQRLPGSLEKIVIVPRNERTPRHIAVATDVFGGRVPYHIHAAIERALQYGRCESAVAHADGIRLARNASRYGEIDDLHQRVRRSLNQYQPGGRAHNRFQCARVGHIDVGRLDWPFGKNASNQVSQTVITVIGRNDMVAWLQSLQQRCRHSHS